MPRPRRHLVVTLLPEEWDRLVIQGRLAERDPYQHARWLLVRGLDAHPSARAQDDREAEAAAPEATTAVA